MAQVLEFKLPDLGEGLTEAEIVRWLVEVGDVVAIDQPVVEVETAKAMVEVPCPYGGVVTARFGEEGTELPVGAPLITVAVGERPASGAGDTSEGSGNVLVGYGTSEAPARRRRVRQERPVSGGSATAGQPGAAGAVNGRSDAAVPPVHAQAGGPATAVTTQAGEPSAPVNGQAGGPGTDDGPVPVISPLVRRLARQNGLDRRGGGDIRGDAQFGALLPFVPL
ncbi:biotin/lipoyl-containing protein, partial [Streptomyces sp. NPDC006265]|uniref:biotin/lipoyl-containing protein n=1 Tax=Streptomyces sp. NPDC006265 TaxID=3156740 RepID=UPI0033BA664F